MDFSKALFIFKKQTDKQRERVTEAINRASADLLKILASLSLSLCLSGFRVQNPSDSNNTPTRSSVPAFQLPTSEPHHGLPPTPLRIRQKKVKGQEEKELTAGPCQHPNDAVPTRRRPGPQQARHSRRGCHRGCG